MKFFDWQWDKIVMENCPVKITWTRWRRGPITVYKKSYVVGNYYTEWFIYPIDNLGFGIHLPVWLTKRFK